MVGEETEKKVDVIDREIRAIHDAIKILKDKKSKLSKRKWALSYDTNESLVRYSAKVIEKIETGQNTWKRLRIGIFEQTYGEEPVQIGSYIRNYSSFYDTFFPFKHKNGKWYALYSKEYTATHIMELPSCKDLDGEKNASNGFCPTGYYVPNYLEMSYYSKKKKEEVFYEDDQVPEDDIWENGWDEFNWNDLKYRDFGFLCGCIWGDDWSWKIQYIDLSEADKGIIKMSEKFGYIWLTHNMNLQESIEMNDFKKIGRFTISLPIVFNADKDYKDFNLSDARPENVLNRYAREDFHWMFNLLDTYLINFSGYLTKDEYTILDKIIKTNKLEDDFNPKILERVEKRYLIKPGSAGNSVITNKSSELVPKVGIDMESEKVVEIEGGISLHEDYLDPNVEELRVIFISPEDLERTKLFLGDSTGVIFKITIEKTKIDSEQNIYSFGYSDRTYFLLWLLGLGWMIFFIYLNYT